MRPHPSPVALSQVLALATTLLSSAPVSGCGGGGGSGSKPAPPASMQSDLASVQATLDRFVADAKGGSAQIRQTEATMEQRLDEDAVRNLVRLLVRVSEARSGDARATDELRTLTLDALAPFADLPYFKDLAVAQAATLVTVQALQTSAACGSYTFDCATACLDDATASATSGLATEGIKSVAEHISGVPIGLAMSGSDLAAFLGTCSAGGPCDRDTFLRLTRDVGLGSIVLAGGTAALVADAPLLALAITLTSTAVSLGLVVRDSAAQLQCCSDFHLSRCLGRCPAPAHLCTFSQPASGAASAPNAACCAEEDGCWACFFQVSNHCPLSSYCGDLCCGSGMRCPAELQMCVPSETAADIPPADAGVNDAGSSADAGVDSGTPVSDSGVPDASVQPKDASTSADGGASGCCCNFEATHYCGNRYDPCWVCQMTSQPPDNTWLCGMNCNAPIEDQCITTCP